MSAQLPEKTPLSSTPAEDYFNMLYGAAWMHSAIATCVNEEAQHTDPHHELQTYLTSLLEPLCNLPDIVVLKWWKDHSILYPTLVRRMA